ncbi:hypothetical protein [Paenibacillus sp. GYB003]|uniref:hypothetical protein n=1 Tax=Paenibacillus sp. GYB003 TaxID=2994392 RepID=UPI002F96AA6E
MVQTWRIRRKWRTGRLRVWRKRLLRQMELMSRRLPIRIRCSLRLSWGPFYGGSVRIDRKCTRATIYIQIPYDRFLTADERDVLSAYELGKSALPYFIFFHECYHLIDALADFRRSGDLAAYRDALAGAVRRSANYRSLPVEACADEYAYRQYAEMRAAAG